MLDQIKRLRWDNFFGWFRNGCGTAAAIIFSTLVYSKPKIAPSKEVADFLFWLVVAFVVFGALAALTAQKEEEE